MTAHSQDTTSPETVTPPKPSQEAGEAIDIILTIFESEIGLNTETEDGDRKLLRSARSELFALAASAALQPQPADAPDVPAGDDGALREAANDLLRMRRGIMADVVSAHSGRGNGASSWMREDDQDMRRDLSAAFDALDAALAAHPSASQEPVASSQEEKLREVCPHCFRLKARNVEEAAAGDCPKWWAITDKDADEDCRRAARASPTDTQEAAEPSAAPIPDARFRCKRCGKSEHEARSASCERGPCPMEAVDE